MQEFNASHFANIYVENIYLHSHSHSSQSIEIKHWLWQWLWLRLYTKHIPTFSIQNYNHTMYWLLCSLNFPSVDWSNKKKYNFQYNVYNDRLLDYSIPVWCQNPPVFWLIISNGIFICLPFHFIVLNRQNISSLCYSKASRIHRLLSITHHNTWNYLFTVCSIYKSGFCFSSHSKNLV